MNKREYLHNIISEFEDNSSFKIMFLILQSEDKITDEIIDKLIIELDNLGTKVLYEDYLEKINQMKSFLVCLKTKEFEWKKEKLNE